MIRRFIPMCVYSGCATALLAATAAAQFNPCCPPTVCARPVAVQTFQPVVVEQRRCCLGFLCDWLWGPRATPVVTAAPVVQTVGFAPCATCPTSPCSACGTNPCGCAALSGGASSTYVPTYAGYNPYQSGQYGSNTSYANYQANYATPGAVWGANSAPGAVAQSNVPSEPNPQGAVQYAGYYSPAVRENPQAQPVVNAAGNNSARVVYINGRPVVYGQ